MVDDKPDLGKPGAGFVLSKVAYTSAYTDKKIKEGLTQKICKPLFYVARPEGFEPPAYGFEVLGNG